MCVCAFIAIVRWPSALEAALEASKLAERRNFARMCASVSELCPSFRASSLRVLREEFRELCPLVLLSSKSESYFAPPSAAAAAGALVEAPASAVEIGKLSSAIEVERLLPAVTGEEPSSAIEVERLLPAVEVEKPSSPSAFLSVSALLFCSSVHLPAVTFRRLP